MVSILSLRQWRRVKENRRMGARTTAFDPAQAPRRHRPRARTRSSPLGQPLLYTARALEPGSAPSQRFCQSPRWSNVLTGEPDAGDPHVRFGGRGGRYPAPTPIKTWPRFRHGNFACVLECGGAPPLFDATEKPGTFVKVSTCTKRLAPKARRRK